MNTGAAQQRRDANEGAAEVSGRAGNPAHDDRAKVPLVVGVTGHRDLLATEEELIKERIRSFFETLMTRFPDLPLLVMTPLAEGADRIAAEVAHHLGIPTVVLLPMPERLYERDFEGDSLAEFQAMRRLGECIELPLIAEFSEADVGSPGQGRDYQYAQLGAYLAAHSHILLAVWDGKPSNAPGGTDHVIKFHQHDVIDLIAAGQHRSPIDFTEDESDLVYHIVCSRKAGPPAEGLEAGEAYWFTRDEIAPRTLHMPDRYQVVFERMSEFSRDLYRPLDPDDVYPLLPEQELKVCGRGARDIDYLYHRADALARRYQSFFYREIRGTLALGLLAGGSFVAFADWPGIPAMIYPYIICIVLVVLLLNWVDRTFAWQRKFLDYRVLAEGLRVQFFWAVAGVQMENPSRFSHDSFLKRQDLELGWIRNVMRYAGFRSDSTDRSSTEARVALCMEHWVKDQYAFYQRKAAERAGRHRITTAIGLVSFLLLLIAAIALAIDQRLVEITAGDMLIALMGLVPYVFAARQNYAFRLAERETMVQYQHYVRIFSNAINLMARAPTLQVKLDILRASGEAALEENGQWLLRQRERPAAATQHIQG